MPKKIRPNLLLNKILIHILKASGLISLITLKKIQKALVEKFAPMGAPSDGVVHHI